MSLSHGNVVCSELTVAAPWVVDIQSGRVGTRCIVGITGVPRSAVHSSVVVEVPGQSVRTHTRIGELYRERCTAENGVGRKVSGWGAYWITRLASPTRCGEAGSVLTVVHHQIGTIIVPVATSTRCVALGLKHHGVQGGAVTDRVAGNRRKPVANSYRF
ncbi:hypothetical protein MSBRW_2747 [Methanosarcina barkeri str. Wiesmoor]|uniref:Uncharacterized protein n=1 Tax=Methanosarcina barkeri str. Wiesmoor TaxID=1434109 RepID=A0A0E3QNK2_METBA|nr:hypothetical protein MSBRW_2747 [Methanosarcina barkeri str. Wiesmoor]